MLFVGRIVPLGFYGSGPSIVPVCAKRKCRYNSGNRHQSAYWQYDITGCSHRHYSGNRHYSTYGHFAPIGAKRLHRHSSGQPALLNPHYRGKSTIFFQSLLLTNTFVNSGATTHAPPALQPATSLKSPQAFYRQAQGVRKYLQDGISPLYTATAGVTANAL